MDTGSPAGPTSPLTVSVVVPVYRGAETIGPLAAEIAPLTEGAITPNGICYRITELILVWDHGPDRSDDVIRDLASEYTWITPVWLSRNFGQHAATVAGMAASSGDWIVTIDEDGQHDPGHIGLLLDDAYTNRSTLVYGAPANRPPHGWFRNTASRLTKTVLLRWLAGDRVSAFHSFRLIAGDAGRAVAAYAGPGVFLDVALSWVVADVSTVAVQRRAEGRAATNYHLRPLLSHFWRLVLSSGNRPLRVVSSFGALCSAAGLLYAVWLIWGRLSGHIEVPGWTSAMVVSLVLGGLVLLSLGVIAEYVGLAATMSMGRPGYIALDDPTLRFKSGPARE